MILDIHTHRLPPYPEGVISLRTFDSPLAEGQLYSAGIHPWDTTDGPSVDALARLEKLAENSQIVMIGECGVDPAKGGPMFRQLQILKAQIDLSERLKKPLILHCVKSADVIMGLKRDLNPSQPWIIHGFRGKPQQARQLTDKGIYLSFGEKFNSDTVMAMPEDMILAETDESILSITEIIGSLSQAANRDLTPQIAANTKRFLQPFSSRSSTSSKPSDPS